MRFAVVMGLLLLCGHAHAQWDQTLPGFKPIAEGGAASEEESKRLHAAPGDHGDCEDEDAGRVLRVPLGDKVVLASNADGVAVYDKGGKLIARSEPFDCMGSQTAMNALAVGQVLASGPPQIVVHYTAGGRRAWNESVAIFSFDGAKLTSLIDVTLTSTEDRGETSSDTKVRLVAPGKLEIAPVGKKKQVIDLAAPKALAIASVKATSTFAGKGDAYAAWRLLKPTLTSVGKGEVRYDSAWCEGKPDEGLGEGVTIMFGQPVALSKVAVGPGVWKTDKLFQSNNRITKLVLETDDGRKLEAAAPEKRLEKAVFTVGGAPVRSVKIVIAGVQKGSMNDSCLTLVELYTEGEKAAKVEVQGK